MKEYTHCTTIDISGQIEVLHARYYTHSFSPHWHEEYAVGLIDAGIEEFQYRGVTHRAGANEVILLNAGDVHTGQGADESGFGFRMLYIPESTIQEISLPNRQQQGSLHFLDAVRGSSPVSQRLMTAHQSVSNGASVLEVESLFTVAIADILDTASSWAIPKSFLGAPTSIVSARDLLHDRLFEDVSLAELATVAGVSKFHFLRSFKDQFGLPPHAYQLQQRILAAKRLLRVVPLAEVAYSCGFADQSHFQRVFRALVGTTPGRYAEQFRSRLPV